MRAINSCFQLCCWCCDRHTENRSDLSTQYLHLFVWIYPHDAVVSRRHRLTHMVIFSWEMGARGNNSNLIIPHGTTPQNPGGTSNLPLPRPSLRPLDNAPQNAQVRHPTRTVLLMLQTPQVRATEKREALCPNNVTLAHRPLQRSLEQDSNDWKNMVKSPASPFRAK